MEVRQAYQTNKGQFRAKEEVKSKNKKREEDG